MGIQSFFAERKFRSLIRTVLNERACQLKRRDAANQLGAIGDTRAFKPLHTAWKSMTNESDRRAICPAIFTLANKLVQVGDRDAIKFMEDLMYKAETPRELKVAACQCIVATEGTDVLLRLVESRNPDVRTLAIHEMGESRHPRFFDVLARTAVSDPQCRYTATLWLRKSGDVRALEPLAHGLEIELWAKNHWRLFPFRTYESETEMALQDALREIAVKTETDMLLHYLKDLPTNVYHAGGRLVLAVFSAETFASRKEARAFDPLMTAFDQWVRKVIIGSFKEEEQVASVLSTAFADALGILGDKRAIPMLITGIGCLRKNVRIAASASLTKLGDSSWQSIRGDDEDYDRIVQTGSPHSFELLLSLLRQANLALCRGMAKGDDLPSIARSLVALGDPRTFEETRNLYGIERASSTLRKALEILAVTRPSSPKR